MISSRLASAITYRTWFRQIGLQHIPSWESQGLVQLTDASYVTRVTVEAVYNVTFAETRAGLPTFHRQLQRNVMDSFKYAAT